MTIVAALAHAPFVWFIIAVVIGVGIVTVRYDA